MKTLTAVPVAPEIQSDALAEKIKRAAQEVSTNAFPASECEMLAQKSGVDYQRLVSDLDTYFYDVWSPANGVKKLARKPDFWRNDLRAYLQKPFFARYAGYASVEALLNQDDAPELCRRLALTDRLREDLTAFLSSTQSIP